MSDKISVRFAKEEDFEDVLELSEGVYDGRDYLPHEFHCWLKKPHKLVFVAEIRGKVIGLQVVSIVDDGRTAVIQAFRIHQEYRGRGYSYQITSAIMKRIRIMYPRLSKVRLTTWYGNIQMRSFVKRMGYKTVMERNYFEFEVNSSVVDLFRKISSQQKELHLMSKKDIVEFLFSGGNFNSIMPQKIIVVNWEPYEIMQSNVDFIFKEDDKCFADVSAEAMRQGKTPKSFSHGRMVSCVNMRVWSCTIYAEEKSAFKAHVTRQLTSSVERLRERNSYFEIINRQSAAIDGTAILQKELLPPGQNITVKNEALLLFEGPTE